MTILSIDGGAERLGWALLDKENGKPVYLDSGLIRTSRPPKVSFQDYRLQLIHTYVTALTAPGSVFDPSFIPVERVVNETLPPIGFNVGVQAYQVNVALTTVQALAFNADIPVSQIAANTVQSLIAIKGKGKKITKVHVRNGVIQLLPELEHRKSDWVKEFDEPDAIAVGLAYLGFKNDS